MGMMKEYLMHKVTEFADQHGLSEEQVYQDDNLYQQAVEYADKCLKRDYAEQNRSTNYGTKR